MAAFPPCQQWRRKPSHRRLEIIVQPIDGKMGFSASRPRVRKTSTESDYLILKSSSTLINHLRHRF